MNRNSGAKTRNPPRWIPLWPHAARRLGLNFAAAIDCVKVGRLPARLVGGRFFVREDAIRAFKRDRAAA